MTQKFIVELWIQQQFMLVTLTVFQSLRSVSLPHTPISYIRVIDPGTQFILLLLNSLWKYQIKSFFSLTHIIPEIGKNHLQKTKSKMSPKTSTSPFHCTLEWQIKLSEHRFGDCTSSLLHVTSFSCFFMASLCFPTNSRALYCETIKCHQQHILILNAF